MVWVIAAAGSSAHTSPTSSSPTLERRNFNDPLSPTARQGVADFKARGMWLKTTASYWPIFLFSCEDGTSSLSAGADGHMTLILSSGSHVESKKLMSRHWANSQSDVLPSLPQCLCQTQDSTLCTQAPPLWRSPGEKFSASRTEVVIKGGWAVRNGVVSDEFSEFYKKGHHYEKCISRFKICSASI